MRAFYSQHQNKFSKHLGAGLAVAIAVWQPMPWASRVADDNPRRQLPRPGDDRQLTGAGHHLVTVGRCSRISEAHSALPWQAGQSGG